MKYWICDLHNENGEGDFNCQRCIDGDIHVENFHINLAAGKCPWGTRWE
jgi:hypothetical protein